MKKILLTFGLILFGNILFAQGIDQYPGLIDALRNAAAEKDNATRLFLYDQLAQKFGLTESGASTQNSANNFESKWIANKKIDPMNDQFRYTFLLEADSGKNEYGDKPVLVLRYSENTTEVYINWHSYLGNDTDDYKYKAKYVTLRIDSDPPSNDLWGNSTDDKATFYDRPDVLDLVKRMGQGSTLVVRCTPYGASPITAVFDIRGLKSASMQYNDALGWWK
jgi:hypothetical protein